MVRVARLAEVMMMFQVEHLVGGKILQHRLRAGDAQRAVPPWTGRKRAVDPLMGKQADPMQRCGGEQIEGDVCRIDPGAAAVVSRQPDRGAGRRQIENQEDSQPRVMSGPGNKMQRLHQAGIKAHPFTRFWPGVRRLFQIRDFHSRPCFNDTAGFVSCKNRLRNFARNAEASPAAPIL